MTRQAKNYYVLGQNGVLGELVRCSDDGATEVEFDHMHLSKCNRIARTRRPVTEEQALEWFKGEMTAIHRRDSRFNIAEPENLFDEIGKRVKRGRDTLNAY